MNTVRHSALRRQMLADLNIALNDPELVDRCIADRGSSTLHGFHRWAHRRPCKVCKRFIPPQNLKYCSQRCQRRQEQRRYRQGRRRRGRDWKWFVMCVPSVVPIEAIAAKLQVEPAEARRRAETDVRRGKLLAYRDPDGLILFVGKRDEATLEIRHARLQAHFASRETEEAVAV